MNLLPVSTRENATVFYNLLSEIGENVIVILSTHIVEDVRELCSKMAIIHKGQVQHEGRPSEAMSALEGKVWEKAISKAEMEDYHKNFNVISAKLVEGKPIIHILTDEHPGDGFVPTSPDLEDVFFSKIM